MNTHAERMSQVLLSAAVRADSGELVCRDYSEEAIPERDPDYRALDGTLHEAQTVEVVPPALRAELARRLEQLGMSAARAAFVTALG